MYKKIDQKDIKYLKSLFEEGYALFGEEISKDYGHDELGTVANMPDALVFVRSAKEVSKAKAEALINAPRARRAPKAEARRVAKGDSSGADIV